MVKYLIQFVAHVDETKRPHDCDFKKEYHLNHMMQFENDEQMMKFVNDVYKQYTVDPGITVFKDGGYHSEQPRQNVEARMFVPWHMFSHFDARLEKIVEPLKPQLIESELLIEPPKETIQ